MLLMNIGLAIVDLPQNLKRTLTIYYAVSKRGQLY